MDTILKAYENVILSINQVVLKLGEDLTSSILYGKDTEDTTNELKEVSNIIGLLSKFCEKHGGNVSYIEDKNLVQITIDNHIITGSIKPNIVNDNISNDSINFSEDEIVNDNLLENNESKLNNIENENDIVNSYEETETLMPDEYLEEDLEEEDIENLNEKNEPNNEISEIKKEDTPISNFPVIEEENIKKTVNELFDMEDSFVNEKKKISSTFVYELFNLNISHYGMPAEKMEVMIAPLKIFKDLFPSVPIIVDVYYNGKHYSKCTLDNSKDAGYQVAMTIGGFDLLFRGSFDSQGVFKSTVSTTGNSITIGDKIIPLGKQSFVPTGYPVQNGHIKFAYENMEGPGRIEIFPLSPDRDEFLVMHRYGTEKWCDLQVLSDMPGGLSTLLINTPDGRSNLVCTWIKDELQAEIVPL